MLCKARNGGSITQQYYGKLKDHMKAKRVVIHQSTVISAGTWSESEQKWSLTLSSTIPADPDALSPPIPISLPKIDHIIYATGMPIKFDTVPCLSSMIASHPIETVGDMPCLNDDLMWNDDIPLFVAGRLAGLRCGPWAGNLDGVRQSAERIAWKVADLLDEDEEQRRRRDSGYGGSEDDDVPVGLDTRRLGLGFGNSFAAFGDGETHHE